jgi:uncharacterized protein (TIGR00725 family)
MNPTIAIFGSSRSTSDQPLYRDAFRLGRTLAEAGFVIANGGYGGLMEATGMGAAEVDGTVIGVTAASVFPDRSGPNPSISQEIVADTVGLRIAHLVDAADATIALPGSLGTTAEFIVAWNTCFVAPLSGRRPKLNIAVGPRLRRLTEHLSEELGADASLITCVDSMSEAAEIAIDHFDLPLRP